LYLLVAKTKTTALAKAKVLAKTAKTVAAEAFPIYRPIQDPLVKLRLKA
jgi:hypothetical protein